MADKPFHYVSVAMKLRKYSPAFPMGTEFMKDVDAIPRAGSLDLIVPSAKDGKVYVVSVPWSDIMQAVRILEN